MHPTVLQQLDPLQQFPEVQISSRSTFNAVSNLVRDTISTNTSDTADIQEHPTVDYSPPKPTTGPHLEVSILKERLQQGDITVSEYEKAMMPLRRQIIDEQNRWFEDTNKAAAPASADRARERLKARGYTDAQIEGLKRQVAIKFATERENEVRYARCTQRNRNGKSL
ncbi:hypothetical protein DENSPDRAFT_842121 [Dentipellis sp. KUC8613]|nr:hypothetical protein DENSPDRAFT_842121 [Dentipellis sp. KUC8613]